MTLYYTFVGIFIAIFIAFANKLPKEYSKLSKKILSTFNIIFVFILGLYCGILIENLNAIKAIKFQGNNEILTALQTAMHDISNEGDKLSSYFLRWLLIIFLTFICFIVIDMYAHFLAEKDIKNKKNKKI